MIKIVYTLHVRWYLLAILFPFFGQLRSQDPGFSQFYNQRLLLNPALAGLDEGLAASGHFREQWFRTAPLGFRTWNACVECRVSPLGLGYGFFVQNDKEGAGLLTTNSVGGALSKTVSIWKNAALHLGLSGSWVEKFISFDQLIFSDQINAHTLQTDPLLANLPPTLADRPEKSRFGSVGAGFAIRGDLPFFKERRIHKKPFGSLGWSVQHINLLAVPEESLLSDATVRLPMRHVIHGGLSFPLPVGWTGSKISYLTLHVLAQAIRQGNRGSFTAGAGMGFDNWTIFALTHRGKNLRPANANAFGISFSKDWSPARLNQSYKLEFGYDFPTGHIGSQTGGTLEVSLRLRWKNVCGQTKNFKEKWKWLFQSFKPQPQCPRFNDGAYTRQH